jgi:hypothetical protein
MIRTAGFRCFVTVCTLSLIASSTTSLKRFFASWSCQLFEVMVESYHPGLACLASYLAMAIPVRLVGFACDVILIRPSQPRAADG